MRRKSIFWVTIILSAAAVLYLARSSLQTARPQPNADVMKSAVILKPRAPEAHASGGADLTKPEAAPQKTTPKVALRMDKKRSLTPNEDYMAPRWSRDGLDVLVTKGKYNGLYLVSRDGTDIRQISDYPGIGYDARWSADGNYIVVEQEDRTLVYDRSGEEVDAALIQPQPRPSVYAKDGVVYLQDGPAQSEGDEIVIADEDQHFEPIASPDENKIAYIGLESGIIIKDLQTQENVFIGQGTDISWIPDGSGIIFNYTQDDGEQIIDGDIYFAYADGSDVKNLTNTPDAIERRPNLSRDGSQLTYEVDGRIFSVEVVIH